MRKFYDVLKKIFSLENIFFMFWFLLLIGFLGSIFVVAYFRFNLGIWDIPFLPFFRGR